MMNMRVVSREVVVNFAKTARSVGVFSKVMLFFSATNPSLLCFPNAPCMYHTIFLCIITLECIPERFFSVSLFDKKKDSFKEGDLNRW